MLSNTSDNGDKSGNTLTDSSADKTEFYFIPPLQQQRHVKVLKILAEYKPKKVSEYKFH